MNDTMIQTVHFGDFYAYDDGNAEVGFGFLRQNERATSQFAYRFPMRESDTLIGIQIWFNHTLADMNRANFDLMIWDAKNDSTPAKESRYIELNLLPDYDETIGFSTYWLNADPPIFLEPGDFFIGFQQQNNAYLNIGFDQNNNAENRMVYKLNNNPNDTVWFPIFYYGSVMMRPVFGTRTATKIGCFEGNNVADNIKVFPNPTDGELRITNYELRIKNVEIFDMNGKRVYVAQPQFLIPNSQFSIDISHLPKGFYILVLHTENGVVSKKIIRH
jgi:hypothetical protein